MGAEHDLLRRKLRALFDEGLAAAQPGAAVRAALASDGRGLPGPGGRRVIIAVGLAAAAMAEAALEVLGPCEALVITDRANLRQIAGARVMEAGYPNPDAAAVRASEAAMATLARLGPEDRVLLMLSAGAEAMLTLPAEGISLAEKRVALDLLRASGASRWDMMLVAQHLSAIKAGGFARAALPARVTTLLLSDDTAAALGEIAGGPLSAPLGGRETARALLELRNLWNWMPATVRARLLAPEPELPELPTEERLVVGSNLQAVGAIAVRGARAYGRPLIGDADEVAHELRAAISAALPGEPMVFGGRIELMAIPMAQDRDGDDPESWEALPDDSDEAGGTATLTRARRRGLLAGAPLHQLALSFALQARDRRLPGPWALLLATTSGGARGSAAAGGALIDSGLVGRITSAGFDWPDCLEHQDPQDLLRRAGALFEIAPTGTSVGDLAIFLRA
ncbi:MAG: DUF4147 domain-containing protein [Rhodobacteraceae bacterium]|nr:DUF4147 domain-containing protein [Paracoccaceae bacterium]